MQTSPGARFRIGVFAVVTRGERALLAQRRDSGWWNLPGGGLEAGETADEGVVREVFEETGLNVEVVRLVGVYSKPQAHEIVLLFECREVGGALHCTDESQAFQWVSPTTLPPQTLPKHAERLEDWSCHYPAAVLRSQRSPSLRDADESGRSHL
ncbi:MAG: NUDIX domain-containing protein [Chloroflexi bacterium]|nr:NUDIX domain-containing protein [Chloroflexota bacterium]